MLFVFYRITEAGEQRSMTMCKRCEVPLPSNYSARKCAFGGMNGLFNSDNWNCGTANALRDIASINKAATRWCDNSIGYVPVPEDAEISGRDWFVVLLWYKHRGRLDNAVWPSTGGPISLEVAEVLIAAFASDLERGEKGQEVNNPYGGRYEW